MRDLAKFLIVVCAIILGIWAVGMVVHIVFGLLHWAIIGAVVLGIGYGVYSLATNNKALGFKRRTLP